MKYVRVSCLCMYVYLYVLVYLLQKRSNFKHLFVVIKLSIHCDVIAGYCKRRKNSYYPNFNPIAIFMSHPQACIYSIFEIMSLNNL
jgi:hypothetical protein